MLCRQMYKSTSRRCRSITPLTTSIRSQSITTTKINDRQQLLLIDSVAHPRARYIDDGRRSISCMRSFITANCNGGSSSSSYDCSHDVQQQNRHMICTTSANNNNLLQSSLQYNTTKYSSIPQLKRQHYHQRYH